MTHDDIRAAAFRELLRTRRPVVPADIGLPPAAVEELRAEGRLRVDGAGAITGSAGLSVAPDRHEIVLDGHRLWTWCAYDILGIFGALAASGRSRSPSPGGGAIDLTFDSGRPQAAPGVVLFRPPESEMACCRNVYEEWCPNSNLFESEAAALAWSAERAVAGRVLGLDEAADLATAAWRDVV
jgi:alkylmercury lyase